MLCSRNEKTHNTTRSNNSSLLLSKIQSRAYPVFLKTDNVNSAVVKYLFALWNVYIYIDERRNIPGLVDCVEPEQYRVDYLQPTPPVRQS